jgi:hypothetical protein
MRFILYAVLCVGHFHSNKSNQAHGNVVITNKEEYVKVKEYYLFTA